MASPLAHLNMCCVIENFGATIENLVIWPRIQALAERDRHRCVISTLEFRIASFVDQSGP